MSTRRIDLTDGWTLRLAGPTDPAGDPAAQAAEAVPVPAEVVAALPIPATVPGTVHTDLLAAGLIPDPYLDLNEEILGWIGHQVWVYETSFEVSAAGGGPRSILEFDGLDTLATIAVNGTVVARTENQHRRYAFDVTEQVRPGANILTIRFDSAWAFGRNEEQRLGVLPGPYLGNPFNFVRKMACNFGWDWGPTLVTAGLWRPVRLATVDVARIAEVTPAVTVSTGSAAGSDGAATGTVTLDVVVDGVDTTGLALTADVLPAGQADLPLELVGEGRAQIDPATGRGRIEVSAEDVELWWPRGFGEQPRYDVVLRLHDADGVPVDSWTTTVGFRTVELDTAEDEIGSAFRIVVNGVPVPARGANWIPDDCFLPRVTEERLRTRIRQATDAQMNLLRIWGGGVYESEEFYRICDEEGVLVWQDFLFACAAYPEDERLWAEVEAEARDNVARLASHPSLVLWNGNNENIWAFDDWGWKDELAGRAWGLGYYLDLLPRVVAEVDPTRPYWPGSPYSGHGAHPNADERGPKHVWDTWNQVDYTVYRDYRPRFVSEFGWQAPPTWSTLTRAIHDDPLTPTSPGVMLHQKAEDGNGKLERGMAPHFGPVLAENTSMTDWHYLTQVLQSRAVTVAVEHYRALRPVCWGVVVWQINDCWPVTSWAAVDGDGRKKPLWYALRSAYAPRAAFIEPTSALTGGPIDAGGDGADDLALTLVNDTREAWATTAVVRRIDTSGAVLAEMAMPLTVDAVGTVRVDLPADVVSVGDPASELLAVTVDGAERALWFFAEDKDLDLGAAPGLDLGWRRDGVDVVVSVAASDLVKDLCLFADRIAPEAEAAEQLLTLLPGESREIRVSGIPVGREEELLTAPVLRHLGEALSR